MTTHFISYMVLLTNESYNMTRHLASSNPSLRKGGKRMLQRITDTCHTEGQPIVSNRADDLRVFWLLKKCISFSSIFCQHVKTCLWCSGLVGKFNGLYVLWQCCALSGPNQRSHIFEIMISISLQALDMVEFI